MKAAVSLPMAEVAELLKDVFQAGGELRLVVHGGSMHPFLRHQVDTVCLSPITATGVKRGDIVLARMADGDFALHRAYKKIGCMWVLLGDGRITTDEPLHEDHILAVVSRWWRGEREIDASGRGVRTLAEIWMRLRFLRGCFRKGWNTWVTIRPRKKDC